MTAQPADARPIKRTMLGGVQLRLVGMILLAVLPLIGARGVVFFNERSQEISAAGLKAHDIARRGAELYRAPIVEAQTLLQLAAQIPEVIGGSPDSCTSFLERAGRNRGWANGFWVIGRDGRAVCTTVPGGLGLDISGRDFFQQAVKHGEFVVSEFFISNLRHVPTSVAALPVFDENGDVIRVLAVTLRLSWFARLAEDLASESDASVLLIDGDGTVMARYPERPALVGKPYANQAVLQKVLGDHHGWTEARSLDGPMRIYGFVQIPGTQAHIVAGFDRAKVLKTIDAKFARAGVAVSLVLLLALLMGIALARNIARPLKLLTAGAEAARRSPDVQLPDVKGYTEVVSLAASLNELLADRRQREEALTAAKAEAERATQQARTAHKRLLDAVDMIPMGFVIFDAEDRYVLWNQRFADIYPARMEINTPGVTFEKSLRVGLARGEIPEAVGREEEWIAERLARHALPCSSQERQLPDGRWILVEERRASDGGSIGIRLDITDIRRREASFRLLFDANPLPMYVYDVTTLEFLAVNDSAVQHYGYSRAQFLAMTILDIRPPEDRERVKRDALTATSDLTGRSTRHRKADGTVIDILLYKSMLTYEGRSASLVAITDVTERRRNEARITHMAHHDGLTDLANRTLFRDRLEKALARAKGGPGVALLCIDLDHFKDINDTLGHPIGDLLLRTVARRLRQCVRERDTVARIGGDEFAVIQDAIAGPEDAELLARRLIDSLSAPFDVDGHEVQVTASVGIATALDDEQSADHLLNHADIALYRAKGKGRRSHCFFEPDMDTELKARRTLELHLRQAFERREFEVHYQPWMNLLTGRVSGCEALLRWTHAERGSVSPAEFIPMAEDIGLIVPLGEWVLRQACMDAVAWPQACSVAVNLSPLQFRSGDLVEAVKSALAASGLAPERLELEITETVLLEDNELTLATLHALRSLGVRIAMDDFGTGYSSLSYLRSFPFDKIKIDRSFVQELPTSAECLTITRGIVGLAAGLGMTTIAEGVETADQLEVLRAIGCTHAQGFLFGAAEPPSVVLRMLALGRSVEDAA